MSNHIRAKGKDFAHFLDTLTPEEIAHCNEVDHRNAQDEFKRFSECFEAGICYLCDKSLESFSKKSACVHWLLKPKGFKKNDLPAVAEKYGFYQIQSYLRWVANYDAFARNINDLPEEGTGKLFEVTIKWRNIEWSFSCSESDYQGHATSQHSKHQHYHFQMRLEKRPFINYSDFHLPFSHMDIINIEAIRSRPEKIRQHFSFGEGMKELLNDETVEHIVNASVPSENENDRMFNLETIVVADEGKAISGDDLYMLIQEAKAKKVTIASLMRKLPNASAQVIVTPGPGTVVQATRGGHKNDA